jgi:hypothetical protein
VSKDGRSSATVVTPPRVDAPVLLSSPPPAQMTLATAKRLRTGGLATAGAGVAMLGGAAYALIKALDAKDASKFDCTGDMCGPIGVGLRAEAVSRGNWATGLGVAGGVCVVTGAALYYIGRRAGGSKSTARADLSPLLHAAAGSLVAGASGMF